MQLDCNEFTYNNPFVYFLFKCKYVLLLGTIKMHLEKSVCEIQSRISYYDSSSMISSSGESNLASTTLSFSRGIEI